MAPHLQIEMWGTRQLLLFFEYEVGCHCPRFDFDPVGYSVGDVNGIAGVEDDLFTAFERGGTGFSGLVGGTVAALYVAASDKNGPSFGDDHLVCPALVQFGIAGADADDV